MSSLEDHLETRWRLERIARETYEISRRLFLAEFSILSKNELIL